MAKTQDRATDFKDRFSAAYEHSPTYGYVNSAYPAMGEVKKSHEGSQSKSPDKEDYSSRDDKATGAEAAYDYSHEQDEVQRSADNSDLGPSRGPSQREIYKF